MQRYSPHYCKVTLQSLCLLVILNWVNPLSFWPSRQIWKYKLTRYMHMKSPKEIHKHIYTSTVLTSFLSLCCSFSCIQLLLNRCSLKWSTWLDSYECNLCVCGACVKALEELVNCDFTPEVCTLYGPALCLRFNLARVQLVLALTNAIAGFPVPGL